MLRTHLATYPSRRQTEHRHRLALVQVNIKQMGQFKAAGFTAISYSALVHFIDYFAEKSHRSFSRIFVSHPGWQYPEQHFFFFWPEAQFWTYTICIFVIQNVGLLLNVRYIMHRACSRERGKQKVVNPPCVKDTDISGTMRLLPVRCLDAVQRWTLRNFLRTPV